MESEYKDENQENLKNVQKFQEEIHQRTESMIELSESNDKLTNQV